MGSCADTQEGDLTSEVAKEVMDAFQAGDYDKVLDDTSAVAAKICWMRMRAAALQRRGEQRFFDVMNAESITDFDAFISLVPEQDPHHSLRGLSYCYDEAYEKGKAQYERHQMAHTQDVETPSGIYSALFVRPEGISKPRIRN